MLARAQQSKPTRFLQQTTTRSSRTCRTSDVRSNFRQLRSRHQRTSDDPTGVPASGQQPPSGVEAPPPHHHQPCRATSTEVLSCLLCRLLWFSPTTVSKPRIEGFCTIQEIKSEIKISRWSLVLPRAPPRSRFLAFCTIQDFQVVFFFSSSPREIKLAERNQAARHLRDTTRRSANQCTSNVPSRVFYFLHPETHEAADGRRAVRADRRRLSAPLRPRRARSADLHAHS